MNYFDFAHDDEAADSATVATPNTAYKRMARRWALPQILMQGTLAMRDAGRQYLPQYPKESDDRYQTRLANSVLYDMYRDIVTTYSARPFSAPVQLAEDADIFFQMLAQNVDLTGRNLTTFAKERLQDLLVYGKTHILVEYPNTTKLQDMLGRELTLADEQELQLRPYMVGISPPSVINWQGERVGGVEQLTRLQVRHVVDVPSQTNRWATRPVHYVVVWMPDMIELWERVSGDEEEEQWEQVAEYPNTLGKIPLVTVYANRKGLLECEPPLEGLAHLNAKHWRNQSDQDNIESVARVPMLFFRGFSKEDVASVEIGPYKVFGNKDPQSDVEVIETDGSAVKVGSDALRQLEEQMQSLALAPVERKSGNPTATELAIEASREISDLEAYVMLLEDGLQQALALSAEWAGRNLDAPAVSISEDLGYSAATGRELEEIREDYKLGVLDRRTYLAERKRRGLYHEAVDVEEILAGLETESPFMVDGTAFIEEPDTVEESA